MTSALLLSTIHGSHLYGLDHADSDIDWYRVVPSWNRARKNDVRHTTAGRYDITTVGLSTWLHFCEEGVPQALEAMFSDYAAVDELRDLRLAYRVGADNMRRTYMRTAKNFIYSDSPKKRRHALRLLWNLRDGLQHGRFNPHLDARRAGDITAWAQDPEEAEKWYEAMRTWCSSL